MHCSGTSHRSGPSRIPSPVRLAAVLGTLVLVASCGSRDIVPIENVRPHVRLTGGPVGGDSVSYRSEFLWAGWDDDGIIDGYQYAVDIPATFTFDEINDPDNHAIAWADTNVFRATFRFTTPTQDTVVTPGGLILPERYKGTHTFYVRSVDNDGAISEADYLTFTARNVTPRTQFTIPKSSKAGQLIEVGRVINVAWEGIDPDSPDPRRRPAYYEYKLFPVNLPPILARVDLTYEVLVSPGPQYPWIRMGADTTSLSLGLETPKGYILAVRAVDEAGGVEHTFLRGRNVLLLSARASNVGAPTVTVTEPSLGTHTFPNEGPVADFEVPVRYPIRFCYTVDMDAYGGELQGINYGVDVDDADVDGPQTNFVGWSRNLCMFGPVSFPQPGIHTITIKARDTGGNVTICTIILNVIAFPLDREVLYIDDFRRSVQGNERDETMDAGVQAMLEAVGVEGPYVLNAWGDRDLNTTPQQIRLSDLARYRTILWSEFGSGQYGPNALVEAAVCGQGRVLQPYLRAGGSLWLYGEQVWGCFKQGSPTVCSAFIPGEADNALFFDEGSVPCDFMHICGGAFRENRTLNPHGFTGATPTADALRDPFPFPGLSLDRTIVRTEGITHVHAMFERIYDASGGLDTLYTMTAVRASSAFNNKPVAFRYRDPDPAPSHGPLAVFGFPYHTLIQGEARAEESGLYSGTGVKGLAASMMNWFRRYRVVPG